MIGAYCKSSSTREDATAAPVGLDRSWTKDLGQGNAQAIFNRVASEIKFEPYLGSMRSPEVTAAVKRANAIDQARLLRKLLIHAGHQVRLVHGRLSADHQRRLVDSAGLVPTDQASEARLNAMMPQEHHWVEVLQDGKWLPLDPTFPTARWNTAYAQRAGVLDEIPPDLQQHIRFTFKGANANGSSQVLGEHRLSVAQLTQSPVSLIISAVPMRRLPQRSGGGLGGAMAGMGGGLAGGSAGQSSAESQKSSGKRYIPRLVHDGASFPFTEYEAPNPKQHPFAKEWLEIDIMLGANVLRSTRRVIFSQRQGTHAPVEQRHFVVTVMSAFVDEAFFQPVRKQYQEQLDAELGPESADLAFLEQREAQLAQMAGHSIGMNFVTASDTLTRKLADSHGAILGHPLPRVYIASTEGKLKSDAFTLTELALDLRLDEIEFWPAAGPELPALLQFARGLQQAILEERTLDSLSALKTTVYTATNVFATVQRDGIPMVTLLPAAAGHADALPNVPDPIRQQLDAALLAGRHITIPERPVPLGQFKRWAWWEVDPSNGRLVGVVERGLHGAMMEYVIVSKTISTDDQRAFVLGLLVGSSSTHTLIAAAALAGQSITEAVKAHIEETLKQLACDSCFHAKLESHVLSVSGKVDCFEVFKISLQNKAKEVSMPFCEAYGKGFLCAAKAILRGLDGFALDLNKPIEFKNSVTCSL